jgi:DNA-binding CsgD family transcriptional regulator
MANILPHTLLSDREFQVFQMLAAGRSMREIAAGLSISVKIVSAHKSRIMEKMHFSKRADLVRYALRHKLLDDTGALFD